MSAPQKLRAAAPAKPALVEGPRALDGLGVVVVIVLCASWGLNQVTAKYALTEIPPMTQAALRSALGFLLLGVYALWRTPGLFARDGSLRGGLLCGLGFSAEFIVLYLGLQWTTASRAVLFLYSAPFFVALGLPWIVPSERLTRLQWLGLTLSFVGVGLAMGVSFGSAEMLLGDVLCLLAGALWAATTLIIKGTGLANARAEKALLYQLGLSAVLIGAVAVARGETMPTHLSPMVAAAFAYQVVWVVVVTFAAWFWMVKRYRAGELSAYTFLTPIFGVAAGHFLMGDPVTPQFLAAVALVAFGIIMVNWPARG